MSSFRDVNITCPECQKEGPYVVYDSVNVTLDPELREKVMDGSLFEWTCPGCGKTFNAPYSFLYHDMTHNFMVQYNADRANFVGFCEFIKIMENKLNVDAVRVYRLQHMKDHPQENILFDHLSDTKQLVFSVYEMHNKLWTSTDRTHAASWDEYEKINDQVQDWKKDKQ